MPGPRKLWTGPCGVSLRDRAIERASSESSSLWLVPSRLAREQVARLLINRSKSCQPPRVWLWEDAWNSIAHSHGSPPARLSRAGQMVVVSEAIERATRLRPVGSSWHGRPPAGLRISSAQLLRTLQSHWTQAGASCSAARLRTTRRSPPKNGRSSAITGPFSASCGPRIGRGPGRSGASRSASYPHPPAELPASSACPSVVVDPNLLGSATTIARLLPAEGGVDDRDPPDRSGAVPRRALCLCRTDPPASS